MGFCDTNFSSSAASDVGDVCQLRRRPSGANFALSLAPPLLPLLRPLLTLVINGQPEEGDVAARVQPQPEKTVDRLFLKHKLPLAAARPQRKCGCRESAWVLACCRPTVSSKPNGTHQTAHAL